MNIWLEWLVKCVVAGTMVGLYSLGIQYISFKFKLSDETIFN